MIKKIELWEPNTLTKHEKRKDLSDEDRVFLLEKADAIEDQAKRQAELQRQMMQQQQMAMDMVQGAKCRSIPAFRSRTFRKGSQSLCRRDLRKYHDYKP